MRPSRVPSGGQSQTPIYDALYSEYRRSFRALPGDRSGEENLGFVAFGLGLSGGRAPLSGHSSGHPAGLSTGLSVHGSSAAHVGSPGRHGAGPAAHTGSPTAWQRVGRHSGRAQAALPPGSRTT
ncbi:hypothetical protein AB0D98_06925 [Streptomyces sp. NPDC047987]|uniref:hypothetical protein n=1 Tax=unclassified Streptomyces TaxID=2593676 RepID=UPI003413B37B